MITRNEVAGKWNQIKGALLEKYGQLSEDDVSRAQGDITRLIGIVEQRTGQARAEIENFVHSSMEEAGSMARRVADASSQFASQAADRMREGYGHVSDSAQQGFATARQTVRRSPMESVAVAFGVGVLAGIVVTLSMRSSHR